MVAHKTGAHSRDNPQECIQVVSGREGVCLAWNFLGNCCINWEQNLCPVVETWKFDMSWNTINGWMHAIRTTPPPIIAECTTKPILGETRKRFKLIGCIRGRYWKLTMFRTGNRLQTNGKILRAWGLWRNKTLWILMSCKMRFERCEEKKAVN